MAASEHPPDTESPLRRLVPSDQIMLSPSCSSPCWLWGCSLPPPPPPALPVSWGWTCRLRGAGRGIASSPPAGVWRAAHSGPSGSPRPPAPPAAAAGPGPAPASAGPAAGRAQPQVPGPSLLPPHLHPHHSLARGQGVPPPRTGGAPKGPQSWQAVPWVSWASLTAGLSFLPPSQPAPPKAAAVNPAMIPTSEPLLLLSFWGAKAGPHFPQTEKAKGTPPWGRDAPSGPGESSGTSAGGLRSACQAPADL